MKSSSESDNDHLWPWLCMNIQLDRRLNAGVIRHYLIVINLTTIIVRLTCTCCVSTYTWRKAYNYCVRNYLVRVSLPIACQYLPTLGQCFTTTCQCLNTMSQCLSTICQYIPTLSQYVTTSCQYLIMACQCLPIAC